MQASILIPTHNRCELLVKTLEGLNGLALPSGIPANDVEVLIIANACTDATVKSATAFRDRSRFPVRIVIEEDAGLNIARNRAIKEARSDILAFIDDDVLVADDWLVNLLAGFERLPAHVIGGRVRLWWEAVSKPDWVDYDPIFKVLLSELDRGEEDVRASGDGCFGIGANIAFRREVFDKVGLFDPALDRKGTSLMGGGETELCGRARAAGLNQYFVPSIAVRHWVAPKRVSVEYLCGVAQGVSESDVRRHNAALSRTFHYRKLVKAAVRMGQRAAAARFYSMAGRDGPHWYNLIKLHEAKGVVRGSLHCLGRPTAGTVS